MRPDVEALAISQKHGRRAHSSVQGRRLCGQILRMPFSQLDVWHARTLVNVGLLMVSNAVESGAALADVLGMA